MFEKTVENVETEQKRKKERVIQQYTGKQNMYNDDIRQALREIHLNHLYLYIVSIHRIPFESGK